MFAYYFIWRMMKSSEYCEINGKKRNLCFSVDANEIIVFRNNNTVEILSAEAFRRDDICEDEDAIMIADHNSSTEPAESRSNIIILASPDSARYHEFVKYGASRYILNPWPIDDIWALYKKDFSYINESKVSSAFDLFGGLPRYVFHPQFETEMRGAIEASVGDYRNIANFVHSTKIKDKAVSFKLLHMYSSDNTYGDNLRFIVASNYVAKKLIENIKEENFNGAVGFMTKCDHPYFQAAIGNMFQELMETAVKPKNIGTLTKLPPKSKGHIATKDFFQFNKEFDIRDNVFDMWVQNGIPLSVFRGELSQMQDYKSFQVKKGVYVNCLKKNFESIDSFAVIDNHILAFQITVSDEHDVKARGLMKLHEFVTSKFIGESFHCHLIFLCLPRENAISSIQRITQGSLDFTFMKDGSWDSWYSKPSEVPDCIKSFIANQWRIDINFDTSNLVKLLQKPFQE